MKRSKLSKNIMKKYKIKILIAFLAILALGITFGIVDFNRVAVKHKKPLFAIGTNLKKDGGSGVYIGLGYAIEITGYFMPEMSNQGVTDYGFYVLGIKV